MIGDAAPLRDSHFLRFLSEYRIEEREHDLALALAGMCQAFRRKCTRQLLPHCRRGSTP